MPRAHLNPSRSITPSLIKTRVLMSLTSWTMATQINPKNKLNHLWNKLKFEKNRVTKNKLIIRVRALIKIKMSKKIPFNIKRWFQNLSSYSCSSRRPNCRSNAASWKQLLKRPLRRSSNSTFTCITLIKTTGGVLMWKSTFSRTMTKLMKSATWMRGSTSLSCRIRRGQLLRSTCQNTSSLLTRYTRTRKP